MHIHQFSVPHVPSIPPCLIVEGRTLDLIHTHVRVITDMVIMKITQFEMEYTISLAAL